MAVKKYDSINSNWSASKNRDHARNYVSNAILSDELNNVEEREGPNGVGLDPNLSHGSALFLSNTKNDNQNGLMYPNQTAVSVSTALLQIHKGISTVSLPRKDEQKNVNGNLQDEMDELEREIDKFLVSGKEQSPMKGGDPRGVGSRIGGISNKLPVVYEDQSGEEDVLQTEPRTDSVLRRREKFLINSGSNESVLYSSGHRRIVSAINN